MLCIIQLYKHQDPDVISQVLSLEYVKSVDDWPHGIKYARWDNDNDSPIDWNWLKILDKLLKPGHFENCKIISHMQMCADMRNVEILTGQIFA